MAYDGSAESIRGIEAARGLAAQFGGTVRALMVVPLATIPYGTSPCAIACRMQRSTWSTRALGASTV